MENSLKKLNYIVFMNENDKVRASKKASMKGLNRKMAYPCRIRDKECDGCGLCEGLVLACPYCGEVCYEFLFFRDSECIGCDSCVERKYI